MNIRKPILLLLFAALAVAGVFYAIHHRNTSERELALSETIEQLDLSGLPDTFRSRLVNAERAARRSKAAQEPVLELARLYHANSFDAKAESHYRTLLEIGDKTIRSKARYYIASIEIARGDLESAVENLAAVLEYQSDYLPALIRLAEIHYKAGNLEEAVSSFEAVLQLDPANPFALIGLARERIQNNDDAMALVHLEALTTANPKSTNGASLFAQVLERNGHSEKAAMARKKILGGWDLPPEDPWMDETMELCYDPQQLSIYFENYKRVGQIDRAMSYLDRIEEVDADNWNLRLMRAYAYEELEKYDKSILYLKQALELGGDPAIIYPLLSRIYFGTARYKEAEDMARKGLALSPNNIEAMETMAGIYLQMNEPEKAISLFRKTLSLDPYHVLANTVIAKYYLQTGDRAAALSHLKTIRKVDSSDLFSRVFLGQYYLESDRPFDALPPLEEALEIDASDEYVRLMLPDAYALIGNIQQKKGAFEEALESYNKALAIDIDRSAAKEGKALLLEKMGRRK